VAHGSLALNGSSVSPLQNGVCSPNSDYRSKFPALGVDFWHSGSASTMQHLQSLAEGVPSTLSVGCTGAVCLQGHAGAFSWPSTSSALLCWCLGASLSGAAPKNAFRYTQPFSALG